MKRRNQVALTLGTVVLLATMSACNERDVDVTGVWGTEGQQSAHLILNDDQTVSGADGCNRIMGQWTREANKVEFGPLATTMMLCEGVDTWLSTAASAQASEQELVLYDAAGKEIGTLPRTK